MTSIVMELVLSNGVAVFFLFYNIDTYQIVEYVKMVFYLIPSFNFSKVLIELFIVTSTHFESERFRWIPVSWHIKFSREEILNTVICLVQGMELLLLELNIELTQ
jgi:hypothetical protein